MRVLIFLVCGLPLFISGCNGKPPEKTVFDTQVQALKKARQVEQKVEDAAQRQREQISEQTETGAGE